MANDYFEKNIIMTYGYEKLIHLTKCYIKIFISVLKDIMETTAEI